MRNPVWWHTLQAQLLGRLRWEDHLSLGVRGQPGKQWHLATDKQNLIREVWLWTL
jgi:hypothetical protein